MDYNNPNDYWMPDLSGLTEEEQEEVRAKTLLYGCGMYIALAIVLLVLMLFTSCTTTKYIPVIEQRTDTLIQTRVQHDSVMLKDSINVRESGDTVYFTRWRTQLVKKEVHDTTYISKTDSVPVPYPVTEYVEKPLAWWQKGLMWMGVALMVIVGYRIIRLFRPPTP